MTSDLFWLVVVIGLASVPVAALSVALMARGHAARIGIAFGIGLICAVPAYMIGVSYFCFAEHAGNLCGLAAVFGTAPLGFSIGALGCAVLSRALPRQQKDDAARRDP
jgi:hypothetical protein